MTNTQWNISRRGLTRGLAAAGLVSGLAMAQPVLADSQAHIQVDLVNAPSTAWITVQWQNPADKSWNTVDGWQGTPDFTWTGAEYKEWEVNSANYGQGPMRWVVYAAQGGSVWATSDPFTLPTGDGVMVDMTLAAKATAKPATTPTPKPVTRPATATLSPFVFTAWTENVGFDTHGAAVADITMMVANVSPTTYVAVQYQDPSGNWQVVSGWKTGVTIDANGVAVIQWGVDKANFGQGPFRWILYSAPGGSVVGVSPTFYLPTDVGVNDIMHLSR